MERGKELPPQLKEALEVQAGLRKAKAPPPVGESYHINQRNEGIDLGGLSGALMATQNMQMQTFVTQASPDSTIDVGDDLAPLPVGIDSKHACATGDVANTLSTNCGSPTGRNGVMMPIAFAQNQRNEVRDLHDVAGALSSQPGMKQQTYCRMTAVVIWVASDIPFSSRKMLKRNKSRRYCR